MTPGIQVVGDEPTLSRRTAGAADGWASRVERAVLLVAGDRPLPANTAKMPRMVADEKNSKPNTLPA
jgi:hypothetical protein